MPPSETDPPCRRGLLRSLGPAIIVASIVLGPGSILTASKVGCAFGFELLWVVAAAAALMVGMTALAARLGVLCAATPGEEIARRAGPRVGRPLAVFVGAVVFGIVACFQFSNNLAIVAAIEGYAGPGTGWRVALLLALNGAVLAVLFGLRRLYRPVEVAMKALVLVMILAFLGNLIFARPDLAGVLRGLVPGLPASLTAQLVPRAVGGQIVDPFVPVQGLIGTTFSVAGAFYTAYLVRQKGWTATDLRRGLVDSVVGISVLAFLTLTVMVTAAAVLHGRVDAAELGSAADVAAQLEPLFGAWAKVLFSAGLLAGGISSFLVNVMIGGTLFADGLGLGGDMDRRGPKMMTAAALLIGMGVALASLDSRPVRLIVFAQALTVLGNPVLAAVLVWLSMRVPTPWWIRGLAVCGLLVMTFLAVRTGMTIYYQLA